MRRHFSSAAALLLAVICIAAIATQANQSGVVLDLQAAPRDGYVALTWQAVPGAASYDIERTPVTERGEPSGEAAIVGVWRPNRHVRAERPVFADAGFVPGVRLQWRVRARVGDVTHEFSAPVAAVTRAPFGPSSFQTEFEASGGAQYTSYEAEIDWTRRLVAQAGTRLRVVSIGRTIQGREINLFVLGLPAPPADAAAISSAASAGANCNIHGNEPSGREGCFMMIRELALSNDPWVVDILANATILIVPSINGDGRAANTRGNAAGQDLNRDHARLTQPETQAFARFLRDYTPDVMVDGHEYGNAGTCDLPLLWPRHSNTPPSVHHEAKTGLVEGWFYEQSAVDGWWPCPYPPAGIAGAQTFTRVTGLKNMITTLVEARSAGGQTRPAEGNGSDEGRRRKAISQLWSIRQALSYHRAHQPAIAKAIADGIAYQRSATGPVVLHGDWDVAAFPAPHPGDRPPPPNPPGPDQTIDPAPCAYFLTDAQYSEKLVDSEKLPEALRTSVGERIEAHGVLVQKVDGGYQVPLAQPLRGLINILLDPEQPPAPIIAAERRSCRGTGLFSTDLP